MVPPPSTHMSEIEKLKAMLKSDKKKKEFVTRKDFLGTGSTLLDLACSGHIRCAFAKGQYILIVGDSASGKTFLLLTCLAEAAMNKNFDKYRFIYDDVEGGALMDMKKYFGSAVAKRLEAPGKDADGTPRSSSSIEEFYYNLDDALDSDVPCIYMLDSMDCLSSKDEEDKFKQSKDAYNKGTTVAGSYGDGKAKKNSSGIRRALNKLRETNSILIIVNQTRDNLGFGFEKKIRSGGRAQRFYATMEIWLSILEKLKKKVKGKDRQTGILCKLQIKKNRLTGQEHSVKTIIYHSHGIDDVESNVNYLVEEGHWKKKGKNISASDFKFSGPKEKLIQHIEENGLERKLQSIVGHVWNDIIEQSAVKRKRRYE